ncbi:MAG: hypothetical protein ACD_22C00007G0003, partial [uncultured bacterium]
FSAVQFYGQELHKLDFYRTISKKITENDLLLLNNNIDYESDKYSRNFVMYTYSPLKWYYNLHTYVFYNFNQADLYKIENQLIKSNKVFILSNSELPLTSIRSKQKLQLLYSHYNVSPNCTYHNYEFLPVYTIKQIKLPDPVGCLIPPTAYYTRYKTYYLYELNKDLYFNNPL